METGVSREEAIKDAIVEQLQELYIIAEHAKDYKVELTDIELEYIESLADEFVKENSKDAQKKTSATKENVMEYMNIMQKLTIVLHLNFLIIIKHIKNGYIVKLKKMKINILLWTD